MKVAFPQLYHDKKVQKALARHPMNVSLTISRLTHAVAQMMKIIHNFYVENATGASQTIQNQTSEY